MVDEGEYGEGDMDVDADAEGEDQDEEDEEEVFDVLFPDFQVEIILFGEDQVDSFDYSVVFTFQVDVDNCKIDFFLIIDLESSFYNTLELFIFSKFTFKVHVCNP